eukprot:1248646-Alexandrium_andersonii.AAC.1
MTAWLPDGAMAATGSPSHISSKAVDAGKGSSVRGKWPAWALHIYSSRVGTATRPPDPLANVS